MSKTEEKKTHLEHIEDLIFDKGIYGAAQSILYLKNLYERPSYMDLQVKVDGSPCIVFGYDPEYGDFFVGTKAVFSCTPKLCYSDCDIDAYYEDMPELSKKLKLALKYLPEITPIGGVFSGDLMFTCETTTYSDPEGTCIRFTPNVITYEVPRTSELGQQIQHAHLGIFVHTRYVGETLQTMKAEYITSDIGFRSTPNVWVDVPIYQKVCGLYGLSVSQKKVFLELINMCMMTIPENLNEMPPKLKKYLKPFVNLYIRMGKLVDSSPECINDFFNVVASKNLNDVKYIQENRKLIHDIFLFHNDIVIAKFHLLECLKSFKDFDLYINEKPNKPEGYVFIDTRNNSAVKLVDRLEFSQVNFNTPKSWMN